MQDKKYWGSLEERNQDPEFIKESKKEFVNDPFLQEVEENTTTNRRSFLKVLGFSVGATAALASCQTPVKYILPYVKQPDQTRGSITDLYATTFFDGLDFCNVLVKSRDGRPIKVEGNPSSLITPKGTSGHAQASIMGVYDSNRLRNPTKGKTKMDWKSVDAEISQALKDNAGKGIRILSTTILSPATRELINRFTEKYENVKLVEYDSISSSAILDANKKSFGKRCIPSYRFDKASMIVGFNADFLGTWLSSTEFSAQWALNRKFDGDKPKVSRHVQFETNLTNTGSSADTRIPIKPSQEGAMILKLHNLIATLTGGEALPGDGMEAPGNYVSAVANELVQNKGRALVVSGSNDVNVQLIVNSINQMLDSYGNTIDIAGHCNLRKGNDAEVQGLLQELNSSQVGAIIVVNANPAYTHPDSKAWADAIKKAPLSIAFTCNENETSVACQYQLAQNHYLESWDIMEPYSGYLTAQQPLITPLFDTRQFADCLMKWTGVEGTYREFIKETSEMGEEKWKNFLSEGVVGSTIKFEKVETKEKEEPKADAHAKDDHKTEEAKTEEKTPTITNIAIVPMRPVKGGGEFAKEGLSAAASAVNSKYTGNKGKIDLVLYSSVGMTDGAMAEIPWLQEFPDPMSRSCWDNFVAIPMKMAEEKGIKTNDVVKVSAGKTTVELPAFVMPGQHRESVAIALGYGRTVVGPAGKDVGKNLFPAVNFDEGYQYYVGGVSVEKTGATHQLARVQTHGTTMGRDVIRETTVEGYDNYIKEYQTEREHLLTHLVSLYPERRPTGHRWGMAIDLNACTGCGSCLIACQAENNIPVVGRDEVRRGREMHWIRIDRYFSDSTPDKKKDWEESPAEYPDVTFQPMMCQHCGDAPCENVCPVLATVHSSEGMNQQAYNRCFGTRYCANNCPYKVRRFNWFDYTNKDRFAYNPVEGLERFVLNPDVTIRARGVMEKCSFCAQRLQAGKLEAKKAGRKLNDSDVQVACASACPSGAIYFGDIMDLEHKVAHLFPRQSPIKLEDRPGNKRAFHVIEELKTKPSVSYLVKVRNRKEKEGTTPKV